MELVFEKKGSSTPFIYRTPKVLPAPSSYKRPLIGPKTCLLCPCFYLSNCGATIGFICYVGQVSYSFVHLLTLENQGRKILIPVSSLMLRVSKFSLAMYHSPCTVPVTVVAVILNTDVSQPFLSPVPEVSTTKDNGAD
jgi:hypothetical protein